MALSRLVVLCTVAATAGLAGASAFRGGSVSVALGHVRTDELHSIMLDELVGALGGQRVNEQRLGQIEQALRPTFQAMPKNEHGNLEHSAVRYVLHRLFVQRHGMYIKGLEPGGEAWNSSSAAEVLEDRVPAFVQGLFEERLRGRGLGMREMAALAATLEHLIHDEAVSRLQTAYQAHGLPVGAALDDTQAEEVLDTYMVLFLLGTNSSAVTQEDVLQERASIESVYPSWPQSQQFAREVRRSVAEQRQAEPGFAGGRLAFEAASAVVEEIGERYGHWQDGECQELKGTLLKLEAPGTGRVPLRDFYGNALDGTWQFTESVDYLRELGALDESDPKRLSVIIPNYVNSPANCLASSGLYSVCCINECEALLGEVERKVAEPDAEPDRIAAVVANLPSATVPAPRALAPELLAKLREVAAQHGGRVPLHGRLFGQWLHHAYPQECPYPHKAGSTKPMTADEWLAERGGVGLTASEEEMRMHVQAAEPAGSGATAPGAAPAPAIMWTAEEELVVSRAHAAPRPSRVRTALRAAACLAAAAAVSLGLWGSVRSTMTGAFAAVGRPPRKDASLPFAMKQHAS